MSSATGAAPDESATAGDAVRVLDWRARQPHVTVRLERAPRLRPVRADAVQIEQVMFNLILNAIEAIERGGAERGEVVVSTTEHDGGVEFAVSDTGDGVAASAAAKLFTPFFTTKDGGLGLGFAISRTIVERHGGRLWVTCDQSAPATTFHFWLPTASDARMLQVA